MNKNTELTLHEVAKLVSDLVYGKKHMNLLQAYSVIFHKYNIDYSYEEIKDYLFHHDLRNDDV